jgi:hypothetical protein
MGPRLDGPRNPLGSMADCVKKVGLVTRRILIVACGVWAVLPQHDGGSDGPVTHVVEAGLIGPRERQRLNTLRMDNGATK